MKIGWLQDESEVIGGAELSGSTLAQHTPEWVDEVVHCPPWKRPPADVDLFVAQNCVSYDARWLEVLQEKPVVKSVRDYLPWGDAKVRRYLLDHADLLIFSSPQQIDAFPFRFDAPHELAPPPVDAGRFQRAAEEYDGERDGVVWIGRLVKEKGAHLISDWSYRTQTPVHIYGDGPDMMKAQIVEPAEYKGSVPYEQVPATLVQYEQFLYMPVWTEPFGRVIVEAACAGLHVQVVGEAGALYWLNERPDELGLVPATELFWKHVEKVLS